MPRNQSHHAHLSAREWQVLKLLAMGLDQPDIAAELFITLNTVKSHTGRMRQRWRARTNAQLVHLGWHHGYLNDAVPRGRT